LGGYDRIEDRFLEGVKFSGFYVGVAGVLGGRDFFVEGDVVHHLNVGLF
jgi:hypothetical protein